MEGQRPGETYCVQQLLDVGGQGVLFLAQDLERPETVLLLKTPSLEYHRPAYLTTDAIQQARATTLWEAYILSLFPGTIFPEFYDLFFDATTLLDPWWRSMVTDQDPYLVMEFIQGQSLDDEIGVRHRAEQVDYESLEQLARNVAREILGLFITMSNEGDGFLYTDLRPANVMLADPRSDRRQRGWRRRFLSEMPLPPCKIDTPVRLVDAGSVIPAQARRWSVRAQHLAYVPVEQYVCYQKQECLPWPDQQFVLYTMAKTLHQVITGREPVAGQDPSFDDPKLERYSSAFVDFLHGMIDGELTFESCRNALDQTEVA